MKSLLAIKVRLIFVKVIRLIFKKFRKIIPSRVNGVFFFDVILSV